MDKLTVENFRCFGERQVANLAPLTLLVGENSTGKTSFMALASILWETVYGNNYLPEFKRYPFDLGTFQEIIHGGANNPKEKFITGFGIDGWECEVTFQKGTSGPEVFHLHMKNAKGLVTWRRDTSGQITFHAKIGKNTWKTLPKNKASHGFETGQAINSKWGISSIQDYVESKTLQPTEGSSIITKEDKEAIKSLVEYPYKNFAKTNIVSLPTAIAPVRSNPSRTYEQGYSVFDFERERTAQYLAAFYFAQDERWEKIKQFLNTNGQKIELFEEISIRPLGKEESDGDPFQLRFKLHNSNGKESWRNIVDVGYGVSQILPIIVEIERRNHPLLLLQQPEVHLHPRAQAGLGSILCDVATPEKKILVETHSDYLIDRVRMDVRDKKTHLKPEDVSILYFERIGTNVQIYNIEIDQKGNVLNSPPGYRKFFMDEVNRDLGL